MRRTAKQLTRCAIFELTPSLAIVVLNGAVAKRIWRIMKKTNPGAAVGIAVFSTFHPSPRVVNPTKSRLTILIWSTRISPRSTCRPGACSAPSSCVSSSSIVVVSLTAATGQSRPSRRVESGLCAARIPHPRRFGASASGTNAPMRRLLLGVSCRSVRTVRVSKPIITKDKHMEKINEASSRQDFKLS